ncbi:MAG: sulfotransferase [Vicinamibacteraceae bacterium]
MDIVKITNGLSRRFKERIVYPRRVKNHSKIFCIGRNKTGTTSLKRAFSDLGFIIGNQRRAEWLLDDYIAGNFEPIIRYCRSAQVFQDFPFSYPETYKHLDEAYPGSKFILSIRESAEHWYQSLTRFHAKRFGHGRLPTPEQLKAADYVYPGWMWKANRAVYQTPETDVYHQASLIKHYNDHNDQVRDYFKGRDCLLVINLTESDAYRRFCHFIGVEPQREAFPWENKTANISPWENSGSRPTTI